jgi:hypothetical protein
MLRVRFRRMALLVLGLAAVVRPGAAATILGGIEDWGRPSGGENNGDFNDLVFQINGNIAFNAPGGMFNNLTSGVVNETGTVFFDNPSGDGTHKNIGYFMLGFGSEQYLATPTGGSVNSVTLVAGGPLTITLIAGITGNTALNVLGWYDPSNPTVLHPLFSGAAQGAMVTFTPSAQFAMYLNNGWGETFSSISSANVAQSGTQQHFAFFTPQGSAVPEPSAGQLGGIGMALLALGSARRRLTR